MTAPHHDYGPAFQRLADAMAEPPPTTINRGVPRPLPTPPPLRADVRSVARFGRWRQALARRTAP